MIEITSDIECGNGRSVRQLGECLFALDVRADPSYCYYFCVRITNRGSAARIRLNVNPDPEHAKAGLSSWPIDKASVVWLRRGTGWCAVPDATFSDADSLQIGDDGYRMSVMLGADETVDISNEIVIPYSEMSRWLTVWAEEPHGRARLTSIGKSLLGHDIHCLTITEPSGQVANRDRILILAGEHATEFAGEWAVRGMVDYLLSDMPQAQRVRQAFVVNIVPQANPDGNVLGQPQVSSSGLDLYKSYGDAVGTISPEAPECSAILDLASQLAPVLLLDMHGYVGPRSHGDPPYHGAYVPPLACYRTETGRIRQQRLMDYLRFETEALSQHQSLVESEPGTLVHRMADEFDSAACLYEPNMADGRHGNMKTGVRVLESLVKALRTADCDTGD